MLHTILKCKLIPACMECMCAYERNQFSHTGPCSLKHGCSEFIVSSELREFIEFKVSCSALLLKFVLWCLIKTQKHCL